MKEVLFKDAHEQVDVGRGHTGAHGGSLDLEVMLKVRGEVIMGEDEQNELHRGLGGGAFVKGVFQGRKAMGVGGVGVKVKDINSCHNNVGKKRGG